LLLDKRFKVHKGSTRRLLMFSQRGQGMTPAFSAVRVVL